MIDRIIGILKWPVAIVCLVFLPGVVYALAFVARDVAHHPGALVPTLAGAAAFVVIWRVLLLPRHARHGIVTCEHELVHALLATLTLHRVSGVRAALHDGGHIRYAGAGNWLIAIGPFVVPLFALVVVALGRWWHEPTAIAALLGVTLAWHVVGNWMAPHRHHGDHREAGRVFAFVVIACVNALVLGLVLAYALHAQSLTAHLAHVRGPTAAFFDWLLKVV